MNDSIEAKVANAAAGVAGKIIATAQLQLSYIGLMHEINQPIEFMDGKGAKKIPGKKSK